MIEILGDKLDLSDIKADESGRLPSPETLKGKILVKVEPERGCSRKALKVQFGCFKKWRASEAPGDYFSSPF